LEQCRREFITVQMSWNAATTILGAGLGIFKMDRNGDGPWTKTPPDSSS